MPETLGKIEKPEAQSFNGGRKLIYVPMVLLAVGKDETLTGLVNLFWQEATGQVENLIAGLGNVTKIFHELVGQEENVLSALDEMNCGSRAMVKKQLDSGASLQVIEEHEILNEFMDWSRCLAMGLQSAQAFETVYQNYIKVHRQRNELIASRISEALKENETGLLLLREGHQVQYAADIQVFYVAPPSLDAIHRHLREHYEGRPKEAEQTEPASVPESEAAAEEESGEQTAAD